MDVRMEQGWKEHLTDEFDKDYFRQLAATVRSEYSTGTVYPPAGKIFAAFDACPWEHVKVVIIGQDPYHGTGQAHGLSFSVPDGVSLPPSLVNIFKEISADTGTPLPVNGDLTRWATQGVLLLNSVLTVKAHTPKSHSGLGWEAFTDAVVRKLNDEKQHLVFMLWGSDAQRKGVCIDRSRHLVLVSVHPSPLSAYRGFFGNRHFSQANRYLQDHGVTPVIW